jgi:hypothetical protein
MEPPVGPETMRLDAEWPAPAPGQVEVMLLGSFHMDGGVDGVDIDVADILADDKQAELRALADAIESWDPDLVAVERPHERRERVNDLYADYRSGDRAFDEESRFDPPHPARSDPETECRSEVVQVGFRLAKRLGHDHVAPVDYTTYDIYEREFDDEFMAAAEAAETELDDAGGPPRKTPTSSPNEAYTDALADRRRDRTIAEHLVELNREPNVRRQQHLQFGEQLAVTHDDVLVGPRAIGVWYERNIRMCHYLWQEMTEDTERILFVVGYGHVSILRDLLRDAPMFCPVSPLPYLWQAVETGD